MSIIHRTTLSPTKMELLSEWLPGRPWYQGTAGMAEPVKAGGFRLDDPRGKVGIEFMVVTDAAGELPVSYHVPLTYRGAPLDDADDVLIGTTEHGVLGQRWVYDGVHDPVLVHQLVALIQGKAKAWAQSENETLDPTVMRRSATLAPLAPAGFTVEDAPDGTLLTVAVGMVGELDMHVSRVLPQAAIPEEERERGSNGYVIAPWRLPDDTVTRSLFVTATLY
jgi:Maltokinase N-terminal cap domain